MFCEKCGFQLRDQAAFCDRCGTLAPQDTLKKTPETAADDNNPEPQKDILLFCKQCGTQISPDAVICSNCGVNLQAYPNIDLDPNTQISPDTAGINADPYKNEEILHDPELEIESVLERSVPNVPYNPYSTNESGSNDTGVYREPYEEPSYNYDEPYDEDAEKEKKLTIIIIVSVVLLIISIGTIIFLFQRSKPKKPELSQPESTESYAETSAPETEPVVTTIDTESEAEASRAIAEESRIAALNALIAGIDNLYDEGGHLLDSTTQADIDAARAQVEELEDSEEKTDLIQILDLTQQYYNAREEVYALLADGILVTQVNQTILDAAKKKIDDLPEMQNSYKSKLREVYNQAQVQFDDYVTADKAVSDLVDMELGGKRPTRVDYNPVKELVDKVKNVDHHQKLTATLDMIDKAISDREPQKDTPTVPEGLDIDAETARIRVIYEYITEHQSSMRMTQQADGSILYEDIENGYSKMEVPAEDGDMRNFTRYYFYEKDKLVFAFFFRSNQEHRFYFINEAMFRWIDEGGVIWDYNSGHLSWQTWETEVRRVGLR